MGEDAVEETRREEGKEACKGSSSQNEDHDEQTRGRAQESEDFSRTREVPESNLEQTTPTEISKW